MPSINKVMMMRGLLGQSKAMVQRAAAKAGPRACFLSTMQPQHQLHEVEPVLHVNRPPLPADYRSSYAWQSPQFKYPNSKSHKNVTTQEPKEMLTAETSNQVPILSFEEFVDSIPEIICRRQKALRNNPEAFDDETEDPVMALFRSVSLTEDDWTRYAHFDPSRPYTRNLIATDHETFTLLLLCWNPDCESKIHDHPCDGCWMQVLQGQVNECRYEYPHQDTGAAVTSRMNENGVNGVETLRCIADETFVSGQLAFIKDSIGLHKVGNPSAVTPAVTLHLYSPPFQDCRVWVDDGESSDEGTACASNMSVARSSCVEHFSEYGKII